MNVDNILGILAFIVELALLTLPTSMMLQRGLFIVDGAFSAEQSFSVNLLSAFETLDVLRLL